MSLCEPGWPKTHDPPGLTGVHHVTSIEPFLVLGSRLANVYQYPLQSRHLAKALSQTLASSWPKEGFLCCGVIFDE